MTVKEKEKIINAFLDYDPKTDKEDDLILIVFKLDLWLREKKNIYIEVFNIKDFNKNDSGYFSSITIRAEDGTRRETMYIPESYQLQLTYFDSFMVSLLYVIDELL